MDIHNKTRRPMVVPLPGGKKLRLGPLQTAQIKPEAAEHPPVKKLLEAGDLEIVATGRSSMGSGKAGRISGRSGHTPLGGVQHKGDR